MKVKMGNYPKHFCPTWDFENWYFSSVRNIPNYFECPTEKMTWFDRFVLKACDFITTAVNFGNQDRKVKIRIDRHDTINACTTLALIIHPLLIKFKEVNQSHVLAGSPHVDNEDVPPELHMGEEHIDSIHMARWVWVLNEMIWTFYQIANDMPDTDQFYSGVDDIQIEKIDEQFSRIVKGPNYTFKVDEEGLKAYQNRINNGLRLFSKYFRNLWI